MEINDSFAAATADVSDTSQVSQPINGFDYTALSVETQEKILKVEDEIDSILRESAYQIGKRLLMVKEDLPHGEFGKWLNSKHWGWSERTARNMMNVAQNFKSATVADLIPAKSLYLLASDSTPESAREEAIKRAENGEKITYKDAKELIESHKQHFDYSDYDAETQEFLKLKTAKIKIMRDIVIAKNRKDLTQIREALGDELFRTLYRKLIKDFSRELGLPDDDLLFFVEFFLPEEFREFMPVENQDA